MVAAAGSGKTSVIVAKTGWLVRNAYRCRDCDGTIEACPVCDGWLNTKWGPRGRFLGCSNFPDCKYTRNLRESTGRGTEQKRTNLEQRRRR